MKSSIGFLCITVVALTFPFLASCSKPAPSADSSPPAPPEPKLSEFTPIKVEGDFLTLTPRTYSETELDELIKTIQIKFRSSGYKVVNFDLNYGPELNLNPGPGGARFTYEGSRLEIDLNTIQLKDGSTVEIDKPYGTSQNWLPADKRFIDRRGISTKAEIKKGTIDKVSGDLVLHLATDILPLEFTRPDDTKKITAEELPIDSFSIIPLWEKDNVEVRFGESIDPKQVVHIRGIDEDGQELKITRFSRALPQRLSYHFEDRGKKLQTIHLFISPKIIERRLPFDLKVGE